MTQHWKSARLLFFFPLETLPLSSLLFIYNTEKIRKPYLHAALQTHIKRKSRTVAKTSWMPFTMKCINLGLK